MAFKGEETYEPGKRRYASQEEIFQKEVEIVGLLDGWPLGQAMEVLEAAKSLLQDTHTVDLKGERFCQFLEELSVSLAASCVGLKPLGNTLPGGGADHQ